MTKSLLLGAGIGTGLMYLLDPERGRRRRAQLRDQLTSMANRTVCQANIAARDLAHRARGFVTETRTLLAGREQSALDDDLVRLKPLLEKGKASAPGKHATREELVGAS